MTFIENIRATTQEALKAEKTKAKKVWDEYIVPSIKKEACKGKSKAWFDMDEEWAGPVQKEIINHWCGIREIATEEGFIVCRSGTGWSISW